jgi:hypothetical protein
METETFLDLLKNAAHWEFELFLIVLFDLLIGVLVWPWIKRSILHHKSDDQKIAELELQVSELRQIIGLVSTHSLAADSKHHEHH